MVLILRRYFQHTHEITHQELIFRLIQSACNRDFAAEFYIVPLTRTSVMRHRAA